MRIQLPDFCIVLLVGPAGQGRTQFAHDHFAPHEILSTADFQQMIFGEAPGQGSIAREALHYILEKRLQHRQLTVLDANMLGQKDRTACRQLSRKYHVPVVAFVFDFEDAVAREWAGPEVSSQQLQVQMALLREEGRGLSNEKVRSIWTFQNPGNWKNLDMERVTLPNNQKQETGAFDIIGDVHGCLSELHQLLEELGYGKEAGKWQHPQNRRVVFVGDLVDRGPQSLAVVDLAREMIQQGAAFLVPGNHDNKLKRWLAGRNVKVQHGLQTTVAELESKEKSYHEELKSFFDQLPPYLELDEGNLVVAHAGIKNSMIGRLDSEIEAFCLYGETTGETDEFGLPIRHNWAGEYDGEALVVYGHTPIPEPLWQGNTLNIDTGCVFGGKLTALRYPERKLISVDALQEYAPPKRPLPSNIPDLSPTEGTDLIDYARLAGRNLISTRLGYYITLREESTSATHEALALFGAHPGWLVYLPFDFSPTKISSRSDFPEHTRSAFAYYKKKGLDECLLHVGGRGKQVAVVLCRNKKTARERFGITREGIGRMFTGKGQLALPDHPQQEAELLEELRKSLDAAGWWENNKSDWVVLEAELEGPQAAVWGGYADEHRHIAQQAETGLAASLVAVEQARANGLPVDGLHQQLLVRQQRAAAYAAEAAQLDRPWRVRLWHLLAWEGNVGHQQPHTWHLDQLERMASSAGRWEIPPFRRVDLISESDIRAANTWFEEQVAAGEGGAIVKPGAFLVDGGTDVLQPGLKVRAPGLFRLVHGPEYESEWPALQNRRLKDKRLRVIRQFALAYEGLNRFVEQEATIQVYECIFTALSLDAVDIDPRH